MKRLMYVILGLCCVSPVAWAQEAEKTAESSEAVEILKKVDAAAKKVNAAKYDVTYKGTGEADSKTPAVEGKAVLAGWSKNTVEKFRIDVTMKRPGSSEATELSAGSDGEDYWLIDHTAKTAYEDIDPAVLGRVGGTAMRAALVAEFVHSEPFSDEINGKKQELLGSEKIGDEDCYKIKVVYASGAQEAIWHFAKKDFLPRARLDSRQGQEGGSQRTITNLVVDPKLDEELFKFKLPEGYKKSDDFAP